MKITPTDIKNQSFGKSFRGYDPAEVDSFLKMMASSLEDLNKENSQLKEKLSTAEATLEGYKELEGNLKQVLLTAQKSAEEIRRNAEKEAQLLMREAKMRCEKAMEESHNVLLGLKRQIADLNNLRKEHIIRLKSMLNTHLNILESMETEDRSYKEELKLVQTPDERKLNPGKETPS